MCKDRDLHVYMPGVYVWVVKMRNNHSLPPLHVRAKHVCASLILIGHFLQKSPMISGSFDNNSSAPLHVCATLPQSSIVRFTVIIGIKLSRELASENCEVPFEILWLKFLKSKLAALKSYINQYRADI